MRNRYPSPALLQEIANLRFELTEEECRKRAEREVQNQPRARRPKESSPWEAAE